MLILHHENKSKNMSNIMKSIKLKINRLGRIRSAEIELKPLMFFSGESGLGKSYLSILSHYFFYVWLSEKRLDSFFAQNKYDFNALINGHGDEKSKILTISKRQFEEWLERDSVDYLKYMLGNEEINADIEVMLPLDFPENLDFYFQREMLGLNNSEEIYNTLTFTHLTYRFKDIGISDESPFSYVMRYAMIKELFGNIRRISSSFVFPPSRGAVMSDDLIGKTGMYETFVNGMDELKKSSEFQEATSKELVEMLQLILDGDVRRDGDKYRYITHGVDMPISAAASSVKEIAPIYLLVKKRDIGKAAILLEEPEAHLHPMKQRLMADIVATLLFGGTCMQITSHSDYFIRRLNEYILAQSILKDKGEDKYLEVCEKLNMNRNIVFDIDRISAYLLVDDGQQSTKVIKQDLHEGVPFSSFCKAIDETMNNVLYLESIIEGDDANN